MKNLECGILPKNKEYGTKKSAVYQAPIYLLNRLKCLSEPLFKDSKLYVIQTTWKYKRQKDLFGKNTIISSVKC